MLLSGLARWLVSSLIIIIISGMTAWFLTPVHTIILGASGPHLRLAHLPAGPRYLVPAPSTGGGSAARAACVRRADLGSSSPATPASAGKPIPEAPSAGAGGVAVASAASRRAVEAVPVSRY